MKAQRDLIKDFRNGSTSGKASNMFIRGNILYSFGTHFPLVIRMPQKSNLPFLLNADVYSSSTSRHQRYCRKLATVQIPFSALIPALKRDLSRSTIYNPFAGLGLRLLETVKLLDKTEERYDTLGYKRAGNFGKTERITVSKWETLSADEQKTYYAEQERRPESCVIMSKNRHFLSSMDGPNYFISELPEPVNNVLSAFDVLMPDSVKGLPNVKRQGEWYFIPTDLKGIPKKYIQKKHPLPNHSPNHLRLHHIARDYVERFTGLDFPIVRGGIRHVNRDHRILYLGEIWHFAVESKHLISWGASGKVD